MNCSEALPVCKAVWEELGLERGKGRRETAWRSMSSAQFNVNNSTNESHETVIVKISIIYQSIITILKYNDQ